MSFAVIGTGPLADVDAGILGMPVLLALGVIRWSPDGAVEIGSTASRARADANLVFDRNSLLLQTRVFGRDVLTTLDTGATTTDLNANFAETFPQAVQGAKKGRTDITGVGGTQAFDSLEIPEVAFGIGPADVLLRQERVVREIRMLRAMRRRLETGIRWLLTGHEGGNLGYSQGAASGLPRQSSTLPR